MSFRRWRRTAALALALFVLAGGWWIVSGNPALGGRAGGARLAAMKASPQWNDGRFRNRLERQDAPFLKSFTSWARGADHTAPDEPPPVQARRRGDFGDAPRGLRITWLGHSTTLVEIDGHLLLLDPVWSKRASPSHGQARTGSTLLRSRCQSCPP